MASPLAAVALITVACAAIDVWWLNRFRTGYPLDINEAQYMGFGLALKHSLAQGGLSGVWHTWGAENQFGPLLPLASVPVFAALGESVVDGFVAQIVFFGVLIFASFRLGARLSSRAGGALLALLVAATPTITDFTRSYEFPVTAAAILTASTYALLASEALERRRWAIAWGVLLGLMPLARTMTIAFVPAQLLAAGWLILSRPGVRRSRLINGGLAVVASLIASATWFVKAWHEQLHYLTNFGYGSQSVNFAQSGSRLSIGYWTRELASTVREDLYLPLALLVGLLVISGVVALISRYRSPAPASTVRSWTRSWISSDAAVVLLVVAEGYLAVTSSRNEGVGFRVPLLPSLLALAVYTLWRLPWRRVRQGFALGLVAVCAFDILMKADVVGAVSGTLSADVPGLGSTAVVQGTGYIQGYVFGALEARYQSATQPLPAYEREWMQAYDAIDAAIIGHGRRDGFAPNVELTTDEPLLNSYDLSFAAQLRFRLSLPVNVLPGPPAAAPFTAFQQVLQGAQRTGTNVFVTVTKVGLSYFGAPATQDAGRQGAFQQAARSLGLVCGAAVALPDARLALIAWPASAPPTTGPGVSAPGCAPVIQRTVPAPGATAVAPSTPVVAQFNVPMSETQTARAFRILRTSDSRPVAGNVTKFGDQALVLTPSRPLARRTRFTAVLTRGAIAATGASLPIAHNWTFSTR